MIQITGEMWKKIQGLLLGTAPRVRRPLNYLVDNPVYNKRVVKKLVEQVKRNRDEAERSTEP